MRAPVLWVSRHDEIAARGYADQALLEAVLSRELWRPADPVGFDHHEVRGDFPEVDGAVVVIEGRHHAESADVEWLLGQIARLRWSVLIVTGDEESVFPWYQFPESEHRRLWIMDPRPEHKNVGYVIPGGWYWNTRDDLRAAFDAHPEERTWRPLEWFFAGQITHQRRQEAAEVLRRMDRGLLVETAGFLQGLPPATYAAHLASAMVVPCPSGPESCDTARPLAAMEAGCVPVVDLLKPKDPQFDYWQLVFREPVPFNGVKSWHDFPAAMNLALAQWPASSTRVWSWWQQWKRRTAHMLDRHVRLASGCARQSMAPDDLVTVIVTTSPIPRHPETDHLEATIASIREQLPDAEIIVVADGVRPEQVEDRTLDYEVYLHRLCYLTNFEWHNVVPLVLPQWGHQANAVRAALELVTTPLVLVCEHDTPLQGEIDWSGITRLVHEGKADAIRLHTDDGIHPEHEYLFLDHETVDIEGVPLRRAAQWWQRPHVASASWYRRMIETTFTRESRTMIEDRFYGVLYENFVVAGEEGWERVCRLFVYTPDGPFKRSGHLDSREGAEKFPMKFV